MSKLTTSAPCVFPIDVVAVVRVPSLIGNLSPVDVLGLGVVWVADSVCGVIVVVLDWVKGLVVNVVTIGKGGLFEERVSSPSKVEVGLSLSSLRMLLTGWLGITAVVD